MALGKKKYQRLHSHNVKRRWKITTIAESLSWFPEFCISRNATSSKSGSHCGKVIKDSKTERKWQRVREKLHSSLHMGGSFGSFYQTDQEESNLMSIRRQIRETVKTVPLSHAERTPKMQCPNEITGSFPSIFAIRSSALRILRVLAHSMLTITTWWHKY